MGAKNLLVGSAMPELPAEVDFLALGSGIAACAAAVAAADAGMAVAMVEKSAKVGGQTAWSQGIVWAGNGGGAPDDSPEETRAYLEYLGGGRNDPEVTGSFVEYAPRALRFFQSKGVPLYAVEALPDHYYPIAPGSKPYGRSHQVRPFECHSLGEWQPKLEFTPYGHGRVTFEDMAAWGGRANYRNWDKQVLAQRETDDIRCQGAGLAGHMFKAVLDAKVPVFTETAAQRLLFADGRVTGVELERGGQLQTIKVRRGVHLGTGAYNASSRLMGWLDEFASWPPTGAPRNQGDGLIMALEHGAAFSVMHWKLTPKLSYYAHDEVYGQPLARTAGPREIAYPHSMLVNDQGRRFADESAFGNVTSKVREFDSWAHRLVNVPCWLIFDAQYLAKYGLPPLPPGSSPPDWLPHDNTIDGLARQLGIDAGGLCTTVERFNHFAATGTDEDFNRGNMPWSKTAAGDSSQENPNLAPVSQAPFCGLPMLPVGGDLVGLVINANGQVVHLRGQPIEGLYASGDVVAERHMGVGQQAGLSLSGGMTFGWLAAKHAAQ